MRGKRRLRRRGGRQPQLLEYTWRPTERLPLPGAGVDREAEHWHP